MHLLVSGSKENLIKFWDSLHWNRALDAVRVSFSALSYRANTLTRCPLAINTKNTIQALAWVPHGNLLASALWDQTVRVYCTFRYRTVCARLPLAYYFHKRVCPPGLKPALRVAALFGGE